MINVIIINLENHKEKRLRALEQINALALPKNAALSWSLDGCEQSANADVVGISATTGGGGTGLAKTADKSATGGAEMGDKTAAGNANHGAEKSKDRFLTNAQIGQIDVHRRFWLPHLRGAAYVMPSRELGVWVLNAITPQTVPTSWAHKNVKFKKRFLRPEEIACAASHILALKAAANGGKSRLLKDNYPLQKLDKNKAVAAARSMQFCVIFPALCSQISLICEDDVIFEPKAGEIIKNLAAQKPSSWANELLLLGHHLQLYADDGYLIATPLRRRSLRQIGGHSWAKHAGMSVGAYAYLLRANAAKTLLHGALPISRPADWLTHQSPLALCAAPALAICEHQSSSTNPGAKKRKISLLRKRFKRAKFFLQYFWRENF